MRPKVILLDCGGTITWPPFDRMDRVLIELSGHSLPADVYYRAYYRSLHGIDLFRLDGRAKPQDIVELHHWAYSIGMEAEAPGFWSVDCTRLMLEREERMGNWDFTLPWIPPAIERLLDGGFRLGVVSNADGYVPEMLARLGYSRYFETIIDSEIVGVAKPDPRIFHIALEQMGLPDYLKQAQRALAGEAEPPPLMFVGDTRAMDVMGAWAAGLHAVLIDPLRLYEGSSFPRVRDVAAFAEELCP